MGGSVYLRVPLIGSIGQCRAYPPGKRDQKEVFLSPQQLLSGDGARFFERPKKAGRKNGAFLWQEDMRKRTTDGSPNLFRFATQQPLSRPNQPPCGFSPHRGPIREAWGVCRLTSPAHESSMRIAYPHQAHFSGPRRRAFPFNGTRWIGLALFEGGP